MSGARACLPLVGLLLAGALCLDGSAAEVPSPRRDVRGQYLDVIRPDRRPPLVGERDQADSLFGPAAASLRGDGIAESHRAGLEALVRRFAPSLVLPKGDNVRRDGQRLQLLPVDPALLADTLRIDRIAAAPYGLRNSADLAYRDASPESLATLVTRSAEYLSHPDELETAYFDFPGENPRQWWDAYAALRTGPDSLAWREPVVFAHPFLDGAGGVFIQYWYFYPFNDYIGNHEGDWEHVGVGVSPDRQRVTAVHYYFHARSVILPDGRYAPEIVDETHPVVYVGGRGYLVLDYPLRLFGHERNSGSHGCFPYSGEWEGAAGLGTTESVSGADQDSARYVAHDRFRVVLTPEPGRIDFRRRPEVLKEWAWFLLPVRWGFPSAPSLGASIRFTDSGNQAPFGPAYNAGWNRTAPGLTYPRYPVRRLSAARSMLEDLAQPWYYLYAFRTPRFVPDAREGRSREDLERLGLVPRSGGAERGLGTTAFGLSLGYPREEFGESFDPTTGFLIWRNLWARARIGPVELLGGYQKFKSSTVDHGSLFVYPLTANLVLRGPEGVVRPYATVGAGAYGWEARFPTSLPDTQGVTSGWRFGQTAALGLEYYLRPRLALDLAVRYHDCKSPGERAGLEGGRLRFFTVQLGHYVRF
jgi:opacity protein-like surface antigen